MAIFLATLYWSLNLDNWAESVDVAGTGGSDASTISERAAIRENFRRFRQRKILQSVNVECWRFFGDSIGYFSMKYRRYIAINRPVNRSIIERYIGNFFAIFATWVLAHVNIFRFKTRSQRFGANWRAAFEPIWTAAFSGVRTRSKYQTRLNVAYLRDVVRRVVTWELSKRFHWIGCICM